MKRFYSAFLVISLLCLMLAACGGTTSSEPTPPSTKPQEIKVTIGDFYIHSPVTTFTTGMKYQFVVTNVGTHYHNFLIMHPMQTTGITIADLYKQALAFIFNIAPNETKSLEFTFDHTAPSGTLELSCHYGGHYEIGMSQPIVVKAASGASVSPYSNNTPPQSTNEQTGGTNTVPCDPLTTTKIVNGAFTPANISLKSGDTLAIVNTDGQFQPSIRSDVPTRRIFGVASKNTTYLTFVAPFPAKLSLVGHPEVKATVSVSTTAGTTCGMTPTKTVMLNADYTKKDHYSFMPTQVSIKKGQSIRLSNLVDQVLMFVSAPDAGLDKFGINRGWEGDLQFTTEGTYTISCVEFPNLKFTVTVQGT